MKFLVVSQRAKTNSSYSLKDLPGHGRFDVIIRTILASLRDLPGDNGRKILVYLKGSKPYGWLSFSDTFEAEDHDEISLAGYLKRNWDTHFTEGSLNDLKDSIPYDLPILLDEQGEKLHFFKKLKSNKLNPLIILGAQRDLTDEDLDIIRPKKLICLGQRSLLASHAIIYLRQLLL